MPQVNFDNLNVLLYEDTPLWQQLLVRELGNSGIVPLEVIKTFAQSQIFNPNFTPAELPIKTIAIVDGNYEPDPKLKRGEQGNIIASQLRALGVLVIGFTTGVIEGANINVQKNEGAQAVTVAINELLMGEVS